MMEHTTFVIVAGFFSSGSSAVTSLLREYRNTYEGEAEFRLIKDPGGICELERALVSDWEIINSTAAIEDFLSLCHVCSRKNTRMPLSPAGLSYAEKINPDFLKLSQKYINRLTQHTYKADFYFQKFKKNYFRYVSDRCRMGLEVYSKGRLKTSHKQICYFAKPTNEEFSEATKDYIEQLYQPHIHSDENSYIVLDQAVSAHNPQVIHRYFRKAKLIVVERDPRDMYVDSIRREAAWDMNPESYEAGKRFAMRQKAMREIRVADPDVMYMRYEDLMMDYENSVEKIEQFLGFTYLDHISPKKYVAPESASKYIGIWKAHEKKYKEAIRAIEIEMEEYLYN